MVCSTFNFVVHPRIGSVVGQCPIVVEGAPNLIAGANLQSVDDIVDSVWSHNLCFVACAVHLPSVQLILKMWAVLGTPLLLKPSGETAENMVHPCTVSCCRPASVWPSKLGQLQHTLVPVLPWYEPLPTYERWMWRESLFANPWPDPPAFGVSAFRWQHFQIDSEEESICGYGGGPPSSHCTRYLNVIPAVLQRQPSLEG